jgi:hypothetical protein
MRRLEGRRNGIMEKPMRSCSCGETYERLQAWRKNLDGVTSLNNQHTHVKTRDVRMSQGKKNMCFTHFKSDM